MGMPAPVEPARPGLLFPRDCAVLNQLTPAAMRRRRTARRGRRAKSFASKSKTNRSFSANAIRSAARAGKSSSASASPSALVPLQTAQRGEKCPLGRGAPACTDIGIIGRCRPGVGGGPFIWRWVSWAVLSSCSQPAVVGCAGRATPTCSARRASPAISSSSSCAKANARYACVRA